MPSSTPSTVSSSRRAAGDDEAPALGWQVAAGRQQHVGALRGLDASEGAEHDRMAGPARLTRRGAAGGNRVPDHPAQRRWHMSEEAGGEVAVTVPRLDVNHADAESRVAALECLVIDVTKADELSGVVYPGPKLLWRCAANRHEASDEVGLALGDLTAQSVDELVVGSVARWVCGERGVQRHVLHSHDVQQPSKAAA